MNPVIAALLGGFVAAVVGWVLGGMLPSTWRAGRIGIAILFAFIGVTQAPRLLPVTASSLERELLRGADSGELARAWRDADPAGFDAFIHEALDARSQGDVGEMIEVLRPRLTAALVQRLPRLSDAEIVAIERSMRDALLVFAAQNPRFCFAIVSGQPINLSPEEVRGTHDAVRTLSRHRMSIFVAAFRADPNTPIDAMSGEELERALSDVHMRTAAIVGEDDIALIQNGGPPSAEDERRYCEVMAEFEQQLAESPEPGRLYRGILLTQAQP